MSLRAHVTTLGAIGVSPGVRFDPHHYLLGDLVADGLNGLRDPMFLAEGSALAKITNGRNLSQDDYDLATSAPSLRYLSVSGIGLGTLIVELCTPLKDPEDHNYEPAIDGSVVGSGHLVLTRSGSPGIAWAPSSQETDVPPLVASGYVFLADVAPGLEPSYVAAVLNHPVWRVWSSSLTTGKDQRNLTQDLVARIPVPLLNQAAQAEISSVYAGAGRAIVRAIDDLQDLADFCDELVSDAGFATTRFERRGFSTELDLGEMLAAAPRLRLDARFHNPLASEFAARARSEPGRHLGDLLTAERVMRRSQPPILEDQLSVENHPYRVIATASIQHGRVVDEATKPVDPEAFEGDGPVVRVGDIVVALDGEGSLGKAAVFEASYEATTDSHIGVLRPSDPMHASAIAVFLNSSAGKSATDRRASGSTGQIQLSSEDLMSIWVPDSIIAGAAAIDARLRAELRDFSTPREIAHELVVEASVEVGRLMLAGGAFARPEAFEELNNIEVLTTLLERAHTSV